MAVILQNLLPKGAYINNLNELFKPENILNEPYNIQDVFDEIPQNEKEYLINSGA